MFWDRIFHKFDSIKITQKLESFYDLKYSEFLLELNKLSSIKLSLNEQEEWSEYFEIRKKELNIIYCEIIKTENLIDDLIFNLYNISQNEQKFIQGNS